MRFLPHFEAKLEYLVHRLELQPNGAKSSDRDQNAGGAGNVRRLDDFRSPKEARARRAAGKNAG
jgi:hypothetical protein